MSKLKYLRKEAGPDISFMDLEYHYYDVHGVENEMKFLVMNGRDAANVIPITTDGQIVMVEQFRFGIQEWTLEIPGGLLDPDEEIEQAVHRELREETGYKCEQLQYLGPIPSNPVFQSVNIHHYLALNVVLAYDRELDDAEDLNVRLLPIREVLDLAHGGKIRHPHTLAALMLAYPRLQELLLAGEE